MSDLSVMESLGFWQTIVELKLVERYDPFRVGKKAYLIASRGSPGSEGHRIITRLEIRVFQDWCEW